MMMKIDTLLLTAFASLLLVQQSDAGAVEITPDNVSDVLKGKNSFVKFVRIITFIFEGDEIGHNRESVVIE
jgi:hypothetical protein